MEEFGIEVERNSSAYIAGVKRHASTHLIKNLNFNFFAIVKY